MSMNVVALQGRLGADPDLKYLEPSGVAVAKVNIAVDIYAGKGDDGKTKFRPCWVTIKAFDKTAQMLADHWRKGDSILVAGRMDMDTWEKDGQKRSMLYVRADKLDFTGQKRNDIDSPAEREYANRQPRTEDAPAQVDTGAGGEPDDSIPF